MPPTRRLALLAVLTASPCSAASDTPRCSVAFQLRSPSCSGVHPAASSSSPRRGRQRRSSTRPAVVSRHVRTDDGGGDRGDAPTPTPPPGKDDVWSSSWFPLAFEAYTDGRRPTRHLLLGAPVVVWRHDGGGDDNNAEGTGTWFAMLDKCPHRLAPLSEGRILPDSGHIECPYHGWSFEGATGRCTRVPQASAQVEASASVLPPGVGTRGCGTAVACEVRQGLLWVHSGRLFGARDAPSSSSSSDPDPDDISRYLVDAIDSPGVLHIDYYRDLPMEWSTLAENVMDPSHLPYTHHGTISRRSAAGPAPLRLRRPVDVSGVSAVRDTDPPGTLDFIAPHLVLSQTDRSGSGSFRDWNVAFAVPTAPGRCRLLVRIAFEVSAMRNPAMRAAFGVAFRLPAWVLHLSNHKILEDDNIFLHHQMHSYRALGPGSSFEEGTYLPTDADRTVIAFHRWLRDYGTQEVMWSPHLVRGAMSARDDVLPRDELISRGAAHTDTCRSCGGARRWMERVVGPGLSVGAAVFAIRAFGGARVRWAQALLAGMFYWAKRSLDAVRRAMEVGRWPPPRNQ